ncbi:hypothetical protein GF382_03775 [Candidatus Falkowbacteria bacterium]|nr:hypothetical protein [Candidatus Falkowbacteria bacterium]
MRFSAMMFVLGLFVSSSQAFFGFCPDCVTRKEMSDSLAAKSDRVFDLEQKVMMDSLSKDKLLREIEGKQVTIAELEEKLQKQKGDIKFFSYLQNKRRKVSVVKRLGLAPVHSGPPQDLFRQEVKDKLVKPIKATPLIKEMEEAFIHQIKNVRPKVGEGENGLYEFMTFSNLRYLDYTYVDLDSADERRAWIYPPVEIWGRKAQLIIWWACFNSAIRWVLECEQDTVKVPIECPPPDTVRDTVAVPDTIEIRDTICPPEEDEPQEYSCRLGEMFLWVGHYSPLPRLASGRGEFIGGRGERFWGCRRVQFGLGAYGNFTTWKSSPGLSNSFEVAAGPALNIRGRRVRLMPFIFYDLQGAWFNSSEDDYWSRQWSHFLFPGATFSAWSKDGDRWIDAWLEGRIMVAGFKTATINGQVRSRLDDPADDNSTIYFGSYMFPFPGFASKKLHFGFSFKTGYFFCDERVQLIPGLVFDINRVWRIGLDYNYTFNSVWESENGSSIGIVINLDLGAVKR